MTRSTAARQPVSTGWRAVAVVGGVVLVSKGVAAGLAGLFTIAKNEAELRGVDAVALLELGGHRKA
jgi:hypothetical protein